MPPVLLAVPAAVALAWWLLRGGPMRRRREPSQFAGDIGNGLAPGATERLAPGEEEPFKRRELPFGRDRDFAGEVIPDFTGGEYGGGYGPTAGEGGNGSAEAGPSALETQTAQLSSGDRSMGSFAERFGGAFAEPTPTYAGIAQQAYSEPAPSIGSFTERFGGVFTPAPPPPAPVTESGHGGRLL